MILPEGIGLVAICLMIGAQVSLRSYLLRYRKHVLGIAGAVILFSVASMIIVQYKLWSVDPVSKFLLPPHQSVWYFLNYAGERFLAPWVIAALSGFLCMKIISALNRRHEERFFENEEPFFFGSAIFLLGYPTFLFYIFFMLWSGIILALFYTVRQKGRAPLYYLWLPVALFAILIVRYAIDSALLSKFNI